MKKRSGARIDAAIACSAPLLYRAPMAFARPFRRWLATWLVCTLLFSQLAIAAHACPKVVESEAPMPCAEMMADASAMMDMDQPGLCVQHCQPASQNVDPGHAPALTLPAIVTMVVVHGLHEPALVLARGSTPTSATAQARPPDIGILHCCLRI